MGPSFGPRAGRVHRNAIADFHRNEVAPDSMTVYMIGDIGLDEARMVVEGAFGRWAARAQIGDESGRRSPGTPGSGDPGGLPGRGVEHHRRRTCPRAASPPEIAQARLALLRASSIDRDGDSALDLDYSSVPGSSGPSMASRSAGRGALPCERSVSWNSLQALRPPRSAVQSSRILTMTSLPNVYAK